MTTYINTATQEYPLYPGDMHLRFPNFDETSVPENYAIVTQPKLPEASDTQEIVELAPILIDGVWTKQFAVFDLTQDRINAIKAEEAAYRSRGQNVDGPGSAPNVIE